MYLGIRAVVKSKLATPREEYMRSCFQGKVLSSEWLSLVMTTPSIISIFSNASWGGYLINGFPLTVAVGQLVYDSYKLVRSYRKDHRVKIFIEFIDRLEKDLREGEAKIDIKLHRWACEELEQLEAKHESNDSYKEAFQKAKRTLDNAGRKLVNDIRFFVPSPEKDDESVADDGEV